jgi:large subunit ribosomal protein L13
VKTFSPKPRHIERRWYVVDAQGAVLGRLASQVAAILRGKHKPIYAPHLDTGDHVIVVNARGVRLTGEKATKKFYVRHSGYPGGIRQMDYARLLAERPARAVEKAVKGMLPKNRLGRAMFRKLNVYEGPEHPHAAQKPVPLRLGETPRWEGLPRPSGTAEAARGPRARGRAGTAETQAGAGPTGRTAKSSAGRGSKVGGGGSGAKATRPRTRARQQEA